MFLSMDTAQMKEFVEDSLMKELAGAVNDTSKIRDLETKLRPLFKVAPQNADNTLPQASVRDVLNQYFLQRGWFIVGLQPEAAKRTNSNNNALQGVTTHNLGVPTVLLDYLGQLHAGRGTKLREVALLAATLEDIAHEETDWNIKKMASKRGFVFHASVDPLPLTEKQVNGLLEAYMMTYITGRNLHAASQMLVHMMKEEMIRAKTVDWDAMNKWISDTMHEVHPSGPVYVKDVFKIGQELGKRYGYFKDKECGKMKSDLLSSESNKAGRIRLADFYDKGRSAPEGKHFNEHLDYLKALGAIDDSDPKDPLVIVPNYITSRPRCKVVSDFLTICCRSECVDIVGQLQREIGKDPATPEKIVQIVSTSLAGAPRKLSVRLVRHLYAIAEKHKGDVPIYGRLFAQWMHHAFPRECPLPSVGVHRSTQTPEEWSETTGVAARLSEEEVLIHIDSQAPDLADSDPLGFEPEEPKAELPWLTLDEEMMGHSSQAPTRNSVLKRVVVLGMLASMAWAAKSLVLKEDTSNDAKMV